MFDEAKRLKLSDLPKLMRLVNSIYQNFSVEELADRGYPDLRSMPQTTNDINTFEYRKKNHPLLDNTNVDLITRTKYFSQSLVESVGIPKQMVYGITDDNGELIIAMGVAVSDYWPTWVVSWVLNSPKYEKEIVNGAVKVFYNVIELYKSHGIAEATWVIPQSRLRAWMRLKQSMEKLVIAQGMKVYEYEHMTEYIVPANTIPQYTFMAKLLGNRSHPYDMYIRRVKFK